jgi:tetratricopeptide (TPR) repeat protein
MVQDGDTLVYSRQVYDRASIKNPKYPIESQRIKAISSTNDFHVVYDSLDFNWPGGDHIVKQQFSNGYLLSKNTNPDKQIIPENQETMILTSYGAAELFLTHTQLHPEFEKDVYLLQDSLRLFRIKVLDSSKNKKHDIALFSLDENNSGEARFLVNEKIVQKREYTVYEKSEGYQSKSIGYETKVDNLYNIDIDKIAYPNSGDYMEAAFQFLNQNKSPDKALEYIDQALELDYNWPSVRNKLIALDFLKKKKEASAFIDSFTKKELITMRQSYRVGRDLMQFQSQQQKADYTTVLYLFKQLSKSHPTEALPHFGIARAYSAQGHFEKAIKALQQSKQLDVEHQYTQQINTNLERLKQKKEMI